MKWLVACLLMSTAAHAEDICDFEHQCYHGDLAHPDKVTPPPAPQYVHPVMPAQPVCHLMEMRTMPSMPPRIVELCSMSPEREAEIRERISRQ